MPHTIHRHIALSSVVLLVLATAPAAGAATEEDAIADPTISATATANADTVDGRHAIKATSKKTERAKKLVATDRYGFLPSNIVKPYWGNVRNKPSGFADGKDDVGYKRVTAWTGVARPWTRTYVEFTVDAAIDVDLSVVPETDGGELILAGQYMETMVKRNGDQVRYRIGFLNDESAPVDVTVRARLSGTKVQLADVIETAKVRVSRESSR